jgi:hypothetical protein
MDLVSILRGMYESEIDASMISRWDMGWELQIEGGHVARGFVDAPEQAAQWFHEQTMIHFPESLYAQKARGEIQQVGGQLKGA